MSGITKYIPVSESEFRKLKELENKEAILTQQELQRPDAIVPLAAAQKAKTQVLFENSSTPDLQEQRFTQLFHIVNDLKRKVEEQSALATKPRRETLPINFANYKVKSTRNKAEKLVDLLGNTMWNSDGELVVDGNAIAGSKADELLNFAVSDWETKYTRNPPTGSDQFMDLIRNKNVPLHVLGKGARQLLDNVQGIAAMPPSPARQTRRGTSLIPRLSLQMRGEDVLNDSKKFGVFMKK